MIIINFTGSFSWRMERIWIRSGWEFIADVRWLGVQVCLYSRKVAEVVATRRWHLAGQDDLWARFVAVRETEPEVEP